MSVARQAIAVGTFGGASALPALVADSQGFFGRMGLTVTRSVTHDSRQLGADLRSGALTIVQAAADNVMAWSDDSGVPVQAWLAGSNGPISLAARGARGVADLRGARIGVDSPRSGFAPILRRLLARGGVADTEVELVSVGATRLRYQALRDGEVAATMLTLPWSRLAQRDGAHVLGDHGHVAPGLLTSCSASLETWLSSHRDVAVAYARGLAAALAWLRDPANGDAACSLLAEDMGVEPAIAADVLATMIDPTQGWPLSMALRGPELTATWSLRAEAVGPPSWPADRYVHRLALA